MPTNKERSEAAARLHEIAPGSDWPDMVAEACGLNPKKMSNSFHEFTGELCDRLADLIEPDERTCTFSVYQTGDEHFPTCSACGYEAVREECEDYVGVVYYEKRHCPNCGAKVVSDV